MAHHLAAAGRDVLGVDAGHLSRILARFGADGLISRARAAPAPGTPPGNMLWTNDVLVDARRSSYERAGFRLAEENAHHSFCHDLVGQIWRLRLADHHD